MRKTLPFPSAIGSQDLYHDVMEFGTWIKPVYPDNYGFAYSQGMASRAIGKFQQDNPYRSHESRGWSGWNDGWLDTEKTVQQ